MTIRAKNVLNKTAQQGLIDPLSFDIEFDGQKYTFGPGEVKTLPHAGMANVSASTYINVDSDTGYSDGTTE